MMEAIATYSAVWQAFALWVTNRCAFHAHPGVACRLLHSQGKSQTLQAKRSMSLLFRQLANYQHN